MKIYEIYDLMENWAPLELQEEWDYSGPQISYRDDELWGIVIAMDVTDVVVDDAIKSGANLIVTHHPFLMGGISHILEDYKGELIKKIIENKISIYSAHTNLDKTEGGVNHQWIDLLNLDEVGVLDEETGLGIIGSVDYSLDELMEILKAREIRNIKAYGARKDRIKKIAVLGGSGADFIDQSVARGADLLITGDVKYHDGQAAYEKGIMVLDLGHYGTEQFALNAIERYLSQYTEVKISVHQSSEFTFEII